MIKLKFDIGLLGTKQNQESCEKKIKKPPNLRYDFLTY